MSEFPVVSQLAVSYDDVVAAARRLHGVAHRTPVMRSRSFDERCGGTVFFKCESLQRAGAFKFRGAYNALSKLSSEEASRGAVAYSSGNHAQAMALAGKILEIPVTIVMPDDAPHVKVDATRGYGAEVIIYDPRTERREELGAAIRDERGLVLVPPFDHPDIVAGQGTAARELFRETGGLDLLLTPCGGGGLLSGCAIAAAAMAPGCRVIGVEPEAGDDANRSFRSGRLESVEYPDTIADGARTLSLGDITFAIVRAKVADMTTVSDEALLRTMRFLFERLKIVVEPTGALAAAAVLERIVDVRDLRVGIVLSGGNVDPTRIGAWFSD